MIEPRTEYDYGTAAIELAYYTVKIEEEVSRRDLCFHTIEECLATVDRARREAKIERYRAHPTRATVTAYAKAMRWVFKHYPQHFALMPGFFAR